MNEFLAGVGITIVVAVFVVLPAVLIARQQDRRQERARHCKRRPRADWRGWLRTGEFAPPPPRPATWGEIGDGMRKPSSEGIAPIVTEDEVAEEWARRPLDGGLCDFHGRYGELGDCTPACPAYAHRQARPTILERDRRDGAVIVDQADRVLLLPDDLRAQPPWGAEGSALPGGRGLMRVGKQPWMTGEMPAIPAPPTPTVLDPGDGLAPEVPLARPYAPEPVYGEAPVATVLEAERLKESMIP
jgi:hypothetical protein